MAIETLFTSGDGASSHGDAQDIFNSSIALSAHLDIAQELTKFSSLAANHAYECSFRRMSTTRQIYTFHNRKYCIQTSNEDYMHALKRSATRGVFSCSVARRVPIMAVVDVIDLTVSSPTLSTIALPDVEASREARRKRQRDERKRDRREQHGKEHEDQRHNGFWEHDRFLEEDNHRDAKKRKRDHAANVTRSPRGRQRSLTPPLFTIDTIGDPSLFIPPSEEPISIDPVHVHVMAKPPLESVVEQSIESPGENGLLLPAHVTVSAHESTPVPNEDPQLSPDSDASGIDFLDDDDLAVGAPRYFHHTTTQTKSTLNRGPCTTCGDDDHNFKTCPNMICMTCGARNEHGSRSCPILRFCWSCKAKGHLAKDCPRVGEKDLRQLNRQDCERCGSWKHHGTNCPSLWRIYTYLTDAERDAVLTERESMCQLGFDNGGEGYIGRDRWCYNCGGNGHLGDDCDRAPPPYDRPNEYSAFGSFNELSGPFASSPSAVPEVHRPPRPWEEGQFDDGHGFFAESNVGKKSRENTMAKAREAQRVLEETNDETDWFSMNRAGSTKEKAKGKPPSRGMSGLPPKPAPPTIHFGLPDSSVSQGPEYDDRGRLPARPSLHDRIDMDDRRPIETSYRDKDRGGQRDREMRREDAERCRDSDRGDTGNYPSCDEPRWDRGSRWRGGYDRYSR